MPLNVGLGPFVQRVDKSFCQQRYSAELRNYLEHRMMVSGIGCETGRSIIKYDKLISNMKCPPKNMPFHGYNALTNKLKLTASKPE